MARSIGNFLIQREGVGSPSHPASRENLCMTDSTISNYSTSPHADDEEYHRLQQTAVSRSKQPTALFSSDTFSTPPMSTIILAGCGIAAAAFAGRLGLNAMRRYKGLPGGAGGKAFYKGGFEQRMNRREATLILQLSYAPPVLNLYMPLGLTCRQRAQPQQGQHPQAPSRPHAHQPP